MRGRTVAAITVAASIAAAGAFAGVRMSQDEPGEIVGSPSSTSTAASATTYVDPRGFTIDHPVTYRRSSFEGHLQIRPAGLPTVEHGGDTFAVSYEVNAGDNEPMDCQGEELAQPGTDGAVRIRGEVVITCDQTGDDGENWYRRTYTFAWGDHTCDHVSLGCESRDSGITLTVRIVAATRALWDEHLAEGEAIVASTRRSAPVPDGELQG